MMHSVLGSVETARVAELPRQQPLPTIETRRAARRAWELRTCTKRTAIICGSDPRGRTKWYGTYTEEQYLAQRQSEERARWAASVRSVTGNLDQAAWSCEGSPLDPPALLSGVAVVIISPRKPVSVGTVARACGSFECEDLRIVMPRQESYITRHAKSASKGAQYILYRAGHYDSIEEATADCDVRIAFTRWAQSSSPHVFKVDISSLITHPAVRRVLEQPLQADQAAVPPPPPPPLPSSDGSWAGQGSAAASPVPPPSPSATPAEPAGSQAGAGAAETGRPAGLAGGGGGGGGTAAGDGVSSSGDVSGSSGDGDSDGGASGSEDGERQCQSGSGRGQGHSGSREPPFEPHSPQLDPYAAVPSGGGSSSCSSGGGAAAGSSSAATPGLIPGSRPPKVALVFGREELGMSDAEVDSCEVCCEVPIGRLQESLSLSHAVSIALCTLYQARLRHLTAAATTGPAAAVALTGGAAPATPSGAPGSAGGTSPAAAAAAAAAARAAGPHPLVPPQTAILQSYI